MSHNHPMPDAVKETDNKLVFSYLSMRNYIGFSGMLLPLALAVYPKRPTKYHGFEPSISDYFYTDRGDILVVILSILGVFLFTYNGYTWKEKALTSIAAIGGLGVAFVPTESKCNDCLQSVHTVTGGVLGNLFGEGMHLACAAVFLFCLALMSLVYFPKTKAASLRTADGHMTQKAKRNIVYKVCGWVIIACLAVLGLYFIIKPDLGSFPVIFVFETIAVEAFGFSWLTKGETLWPDGEHYFVKAYKDARNAFK